MLRILEKVLKIDLYKKQINELEQQVKDRNNLLKHISYKAEDFAGLNWYSCSNAGFRKIKELAETFPNSNKF